MHSADWQVIGTIVAAVGVAGSFWLTWRGQREEARRAHNSAERSENAARLTEDYTSRVVTALELLATNTAIGGAPPAPAVRWSMVHTTNHQYRLTNEGNAKATSVKLDAHESLGGLIDIQGGPDLGPGEALTFLAAPDYDTTDMTITVTWTDEAGQPGQWRYPLPH
jgi:hypothetical protein